MRLESLYLKNFRNLTGTCEFAPNFALLVGENNSGKSNVIDALRIILTAAGGPREQLTPTREDFPHDSNGVRTSDSFTLEVVFTELSLDEQGRMVTCLTPSKGPRTAKLGLTCSMADEELISNTWYGGDRENTDIELLARWTTRFTYLPALRNAQSDLSPGRTNLLRRLLSAITVDDEERRKIENLVRVSNSELGLETK